MKKYLLLFLLCSPLQAAVVRWNLEDVLLDDGVTLSGYFLFDDVAVTVVEAYVESPRSPLAPPLVLPENPTFLDWTGNYAPFQFDVPLADAGVDFADDDLVQLIYSGNNGFVIPTVFLGTANRLLVLNLEASLLSGQSRIAITPGVASQESESTVIASIFPGGISSIGGGERQIVSGWVTQVPEPHTVILSLIALIPALRRRR